MSSERPAHPWGALSALCLGFFMIMIDTSIVMVAIPDLMRELDTSLNAVTWITSAYVLGWAVPLLLSGRLGDRYGRRRVFLSGLIVFTLASLWCGLSGSAEALIAARALQGVGAALITPHTLAFITYLFPEGRRGPAFGVWGAVAGLGNVAGPLLGGVLVQTLGWPWIFYVNLPIGAAAIAMTFALVPAWRPGHRHSFDVPGLLLSGLGLFCLIFGIQNGQQFQWGEVALGVTITELLVAGGVLLVAFVVWQHLNRAEPLVPLSLFRTRNFALGSTANVLLGVCLAGGVLPLMLYLQNARGLSPLQAGLFLAPSALLSAVVAPAIGRFTDGPAAKYIGAVGFAALAGGLGYIALVAEPDGSIVGLLPGILLFGIGTGTVFTPLNQVSISAVPPHQIGAGSGVFNTFRQVGTVLGAASVSVLLQARLAAGNDLTTAAGQALGLPIAALTVGAVLCLLFAVRRTGSDPGRSASPRRPPRRQGSLSAR